MASIIGSALSSVIPTVLGSVLSSGVTTLGQVIQNKLDDYKNYGKNKMQTNDKNLMKVIQSVGVQVVRNTRDIKNIKDRMDIE